ncbi:MAG: WD40/YVTN/BNR-like repeat-containing protein, partial [Candidatus Dormibacteraceae bacterium]
MTFSSPDSFHVRRPLVYGFAAAVLGILSCGNPVHAGPIDPALFSGMHWRNIGPYRAGRSVAVAGVPGQPNVFYFGAVDGGVWKTVDAGWQWKPIFDDEPIASIGAIAVAPSDPNVLYVGTGEADPRSQVSDGDGMAKSTDAGKTLEHIGLDKTGHSGTVNVDPRTP